MDATSRYNRHPVLWAALLLLALTFAIYERTLPYEAINYDDPGLVTENEHVKELSFRQIGFFFTPGTMRAYTPLRWLSYALDYALWDGAVVGIRLVNVFLFFFTCFFAFLFIRRFLGLRWPEWSQERMNLAALLAAAAFLVHPIHVESVVWLSARKDVLMGTFFFAGLFAYLFTHDTRGRTLAAAWAVTFLCFVAALFSKTFAIAFPAAMLAVDITLIRTVKWKNLAGRAFLYLPFVAVNIWFIRVSLAASLGLESFREAVNAKIFTGFVPNRFYLASQIFARYLGLTAWPDPLTVQYLYDLKWTLLDRQLWLDIAVVVLFAALGVLLLIKRRRWAFPMIFFAAALSPAVGIVPSSIYWADRYLFIAILGPALLLSLLTMRLLVSIDKRRWRIAALSISGAVLTAWFLLSIIQAGRWRNSIDLFEYTLEREPRHHMAASLLAQAHFERGDLEKAWTANETAFALKPDDDQIMSRRGILLFELGKREEARKFLEKAARENPEFSRARKNLGLVYIKLGNIQEGLKTYAEGVKLRDWDFHEILNYARFLKDLHEYRKALSQYERLENLFKETGAAIPEDEIEEVRRILGECP